MPRFAWRALVQRRLDLAALAIDLVVPPFSLAIGAWAVAMLSTLVAGLCGASCTLLQAILLSVVRSVTCTGVASCVFFFFFVFLYFVVAFGGGPVTYC